MPCNQKLERCVTLERGRLKSTPSHPTSAKQNVLGVEKNTGVAHPPPLEVIPRKAPGMASLISYVTKSRLSEAIMPNMVENISPLSSLYGGRSKQVAPRRCPPVLPARRACRRCDECKGLTQGWALTKPLLGYVPRAGPCFALRY